MPDDKLSLTQHATCSATSYKTILPYMESVWRYKLNSDQFRMILLPQQRKFLLPVLKANRTTPTLVLSLLAYVQLLGILVESWLLPVPVNRTDHYRRYGAAQTHGNTQLNWSSSDTRNWNNTTYTRWRADHTTGQLTPHSIYQGTISQHSHLSILYYVPDWTRSVHGAPPKLCAAANWKSTVKLRMMSTIRI